MNNFAENITKQLITSGPEAIGMCKDLLSKVPEMPIKEAGEFTADVISKMRISDEGQEGMNAFFEKRKHLPFNDSKKENIHSHITRSVQAYNNDDFNFFLDNMPARDHWRAYPDLKHKCCFLDIETTGLSKHYNDITLIGLYNGKQSKVFINGKNLDQFQNEIKKYDHRVYS